MDGYYCITLSSSGGLQMGIIMPMPDNCESLIPFPITLPMGWNTSPPFFCTFIEMAADLCHTCIHQPSCLPPHPMESQANMHLPAHSASQLHGLPPCAPPFNAQPPTKPLTLVDVYLNDFIGVDQTAPVMQHIQQTALHKISDVFHSNDTSDMFCKQPISQSKLAKGNAAWDTDKTILDWCMNTAMGTLHL